jgi:hypothetical protein
MENFLDELSDKINSSKALLAESTKIQMVNVLSPLLRELIEKMPDGEEIEGGTIFKYRISRKGAAFERKKEHHMEPARFLSLYLDIDSINCIDPVYANAKRVLSSMYVAQEKYGIRIEGKYLDDAISRRLKISRN